MDEILRRKAIPYLITAITDSMMHLVASSSQLDPDVLRDDGAMNCWGKGVHRVVAMSFLGETVFAEVKIFTILAMQELLCGQFYNMIRLARVEKDGGYRHSHSPWIQLLQVRILIRPTRAAVVSSSLARFS